jgi:hypothetical protein
MYFRAILVFLTVALSLDIVGGVAIPASSTSENPISTIVTNIGKRNEHCGHSTFINKSSSGSPRATDCSKLAAWLRKTPHTWLIPPGRMELAQEGSCVFAVNTANTGNPFVGNDDVADLIQDAVRMFKWNHMIGAEGEMGCPGK